MTADQARAFRDAWTASGYAPLVAHAPYLVNIASANDAFLARSRSLALSTLDACASIGAEYLVVHAGTGGADPHGAVVTRAAESLRLLAAHGSPTTVLVELEEGISAATASTVGDAARLFAEAGTDQVGLCLDTCHLFATGYPLGTSQGVAQLFDELREMGLLERVAVIHANDAMFERGSHRDRHENIGDGHIGLDGFRALLSRPELTDLTLILETPGGADRHAADIAALRALAP